MKVTQLQGRGIIVPKIKNPDMEGHRPAGYEFFPLFCPSVLILAKKQSGKTTTLWNILMRRLTRKHKLIVFCSTIHKDPTWNDVIFPWLDKHKISYVAETNFVGKDANGLKYNLLKDLMTIIETKPEQPLILVIDDLSPDLKNDGLLALLKQSKHLNMSVFILTQYLNDLAPSGLSQLDNVLVFPRQGSKKIQELHSKLELAVSLQKFREMYHYATNEQHSFLYIQRDPESYRKNFDKLIELESEDMDDETE